MNYMKIIACLLHKRQNIEPLVKSPQTKHMIEKHHIIMRSIGGSNDKSNLVNLTLREHYVMHELLVKVYEGTQYEAQAVKAWNNMSRKMPSKVKLSRLYEKFRSRYNKVAGQSIGGKICITDGRKNKYIYPTDPMPENFYRGMHHTQRGLQNIKRGCLSRTGMIIVTNGHKNKWVWPDSIPNGFYVGTTYQTNTGKIVVNNGSTSRMVYPDEIPDGFEIGALPFPEERRQKIIESHKNMSEQTKKERNQKISNKLKGRKTGRKLSEEHKLALKLGRRNSKFKLTDEQRRNISNRQRGKIKVNNGIKTIYADPNDIPDGFVKGQLHKNKLSSK